MDLPEDVLGLMLMKLPPKDILNVCIAYKHILSDNEIFWRLVAERNYRHINPVDDQTWKNLVVLMVGVEKYCTHDQAKVAVRQQNINMFVHFVQFNEKILYRMISYALDNKYVAMLQMILSRYSRTLKSGEFSEVYEDMIGHLISQHFDPEYIQSIIDIFSENQFPPIGGHQWSAWINDGILLKVDEELFTYLLQHTNNPNHYLPLAIKSNNLMAVELLLQVGANDWDTGLLVAARANNLVLVELFLSGYPSTECIYEALIVAVDNRSLGMVNALLNSGNKLSLPHLNRVFDVALKSNRTDIIDRLVAAGANDWPNALYLSAMNDNVSEVMRFAKLVCDGAVDLDKCLTPALSAAANRGNVVIVKLLIQLGATNYSAVLIGAATAGDMELVKWALASGPVTDDAYAKAMLQAASTGKNLIVKFLVITGKISKEHMIKGLMIASSTKNDELRLIFKNVIATMK